MIHFPPALPCPRPDVAATATEGGGLCIPLTHSTSLKDCEVGAGSCFMLSIAPLALSPGHDLKRLPLRAVIRLLDVRPCHALVVNVVFDVGGVCHDGLLDVWDIGHPRPVARVRRAVPVNPPVCKPHNRQNEEASCYRPENDVAHDALQIAITATAQIAIIDTASGHVIGGSVAIASTVFTWCCGCC